MFYLIVAAIKHMNLCQSTGTSSATGIDNVAEFDKYLFKS